MKYVYKTKEKPFKTFEVEQSMLEDAYEKYEIDGVLVNVERVISGGSFILKGDGWAKDNYMKAAPTTTD